MKAFSRFGLPARWWRGQPSPVMLAKTAEPGAPGRGEDTFRVLMVDDEELIRRLATGMASRFRIDLSTVASAPAALDLARAGRLDVLVTDVVLGEGADGIDLARQILALQPWASVVLMSGYSAAHFDLESLPGDTQFLTKPFGVDALMHCLTEARHRVSASGR
jgi:DNA-binding NtrC family response regulator